MGPAFFPRFAAERGSEPEYQDTTLPSNIGWKKSADSLGGGKRDEPFDDE